MRDLIETEIGPVDGSVEPMVINPYDMGATDEIEMVEAPPFSIGPGTSTPRHGTPRRSILRSSIRRSGTPKRGAAAKLDLHRSGRKLTTIEILQGKRSWATAPEVETPMRNHLVETPSRQVDEMEVDDLFDTPTKETPAPPSELPTKTAPPAPFAPTPSKAAPPAPFVIPPFTKAKIPIPAFPLPQPRPR